MSNADTPLGRVSTKILEDWAMMFVEEVEPRSEIFDLSKPFYFGSVDFKGTFSGILGVIFQDAFLKAVAINLLGMDGDVEPSKADKLDAAAEMVNILTGNFLTEAYGADEVFDVVAPRVVELRSNTITEAIKGKQVVCFMADDAPVAITMALTTP